MASPRNMFMSENGIFFGGGGVQLHVVKFIVDC
jgi:hypothetical protein